MLPDDIDSLYTLLRSSCIAQLVEKLVAGPPSTCFVSEGEAITGLVSLAGVVVVVVVVVVEVGWYFLGKWSV